MRLSTFQNKGDGGRRDVGNLQNPCFCLLYSYGVPFQALPLAVALLRVVGVPVRYHTEVDKLVVWS